MGADPPETDPLQGIAVCPEVEPGPVGDFDDDVALLEAAFSLFLVPWHVLGVIDREERLTALGVWTLPRSLAGALGLGLRRGGLTVQQGAG